MKNAKIVLMIVSVMFLTNCSQDKSPFQATAFSLIDSEEGANFTLTYPDGRE